MPSVDQTIRMAIDHHRAGRTDRAIDLLRRALRHAPGHPDAHHVLGNLLMQKGRLDQAHDHLRKAVNARPSPMFLNSLGGVLCVMGRQEEAIAPYTRAVELDPRCFPALNGLAGALAGLGRYDEADDAFTRAIAAQPRRPEPIGNRAMLLLITGRADEAAALLRDGVARFPNDPNLQSKFAHALNYASGTDPRDVFEQHARFGRLLRKPAPDFPNSPETNRRIRIGYLSPDLHTHSVAYYLRAILANHDHEAFEVFCYDSGSIEDEMTQRLKADADAWRPVPAIDDAALVQTIRDDQIDILVELSGHTTGNRLPALAHKPAPVQATFIGYPNTTGLDAIDHRIVDDITDPAPDADALAVEKLVRLPGCFLCYTPPPPSPQDNTPEPASTRSSAGPITFGSFNNVSKITVPLIHTWARVLEAVEGSRLVLKNRALEHESVRDHLLGAFAGAGIDAGRLTLLGKTPTTAEHLACYHQIDIALDTFPYHGTTTTCEALWMGVPVVTQIGRVHGSRVGLSLLTCLGLEELAAYDEDGFVRIAVELAADRPRLAELHATLRDRLLTSPLCDGPAYTRRLEEAYRSMWQSWCRDRPKPGAQATG